MAKLYKTKTFWGGVVGILGGVAIILAGDAAGGCATITASLMAILGRQLPPAQ